MNPSKGFLRAWLLPAAVLTLFLPLRAQAPQWWAARGVIGGGTAANDYAAATQGQLKQMAKLAMDELDASMPGGAGVDIHAMVDGWSTDTSQAKDYSVATIGNLKTVAAPFYNRLQKSYPWTSTTSDDNDSAIVTVGQIKQAFGFEVNPDDVDQLITIPEDVTESVFLGKGTLTGTISYQITTAPAHGLLLGTAPNLTYQPFAHYNGTDNFVFQVSNGTQTLVGHVAITITPIDDPPLVDAGDLTQATVGVPLSIAGTITDIDTPPGSITTLWKKLVGPGSADFDDDEALSTTVTFDAPGDYYLDLTASGGGAPRSDTLLVKVHGANPPPAPTVSLSVSPTVVNRPSPIHLVATVSGSCTKVEFCKGGSVIYTDFTAPYEYDWTSSRLGQFRLKALAYAGEGVSLSASTTVTVQQTTGGFFSGPGNNGDPTSGGNGGSNPGGTTPPGDPTIDWEVHDEDDDGLTDAEEDRLGTQMGTPDSDGDGLDDAHDAWANVQAIKIPRVQEAGYAVINLSAAPYGIPAGATIIGMDDYGDVAYYLDGSPRQDYVVRVDTHETVPVSFEVASLSRNGVLAGTYRPAIGPQLGKHWDFRNGASVQTDDPFPPGTSSESTASNGTVTACRGGYVIPGPPKDITYGLAYRNPQASYPTVDVYGDGQDLRAKFSDLMGEVVNKTGVIGGNRKVTSNVAGGMDPEMILISSTGGSGMRFQSYKFLDLSESTDTNNAQKALALGKPLSGNSAALFVQSGDSWAPMEITAFDPWVRSERPISNAKKVNARGEILIDEGIVRNGVLRRFSDLTSKWVIEPGQEIDLNSKGMILATGTPVGGSGAALILLVPIEITFEPVGDNDNISDNKKKVFDIQGNTKPDEWMPGKGKRVFPDAKNKNDSTPRNTVNVKVSIGMPNVKVYLKVLDIDDPTPLGDDPEGIIDTTDHGGEKGNDNNGAPAVFASGSSSQIECATDGNGVAKIGGNLPELRVGMKPGDNYRVAVTVMKSDDMSVLQVTNENGAGYVPSGDGQCSEFNGGLSPMLTVWRKLNLEIDSMQAVPNPKPEPDRKQFINTEILGTNEIRAQPSSGQLPISAFYNGGYVTKGTQKDEIGSYVVYATPPFIGLVRFELSSNSSGIGSGDSFIAYDDDDKYLAELGIPAPLPRNDTHADVVNKIQIRFSPAYIEVVDANANGWNQNQVIPFEMNFPIESRNSTAQGVRDLPDRETFWSHQLIFIYQDTASLDADPIDEIIRNGATNKGASPEWSVVSMEAIRESELQFITSEVLANQASHPFYRGSYERRMLGVIAHEIGHAPANKSNDADHAESGLMRDGAGYIEDKFEPETISRFRKATSWSN